MDCRSLVAFRAVSMVVFGGSVSTLLIPFLLHSTMISYALPHM